VTLAFAAPAFATEAQLLTRADCEQAGMAWDENANVCGGSDKAVENKQEKKRKRRARRINRA
jgi:hypothetical protein